MVKADKKTTERKVQKATVAKVARRIAPVPATSKEILAKAQIEFSKGKQKKVEKPSKKPAPKSASDSSDSSDSDSKNEENVKPKTNGKAKDLSDKSSEKSSSEDEPSKASQVKAPTKKAAASSSDSSSSESESDDDDTVKKLPDGKLTRSSAKTNAVSTADVGSSSSDDSSDSESESDAKPTISKTIKTNSLAKTTPSSSSSSSEEDDSDLEVPSKQETTKVKPTPKVVSKRTKPEVAAATKADSSDSSDTSDSESDSESSKPAVKAPNGTAKGDGSSDSESDSESDSDMDPDKDASTAAAKKLAASSSSEGSDSDSSGSEESDSDVEMEEAGKPTVKPTTNGKRKAADEGQPETKKVKLDPVTEGVTSIFVGKLSWSVDNDRLAQEFSHCGEILSATVQLDRNTGKSRGFGYVHFSTADAVEKAMKMDGTEIDGRAIRVDQSTTPTSGQVRDRRAKAFNDEISPPSNTLFIGNLPFSITEDSLWSYFEGYSVKTIRLPTDRESGQLKGFGYVELENIDDAKKAFDALSGTEIEGRRVRLDYSQPRDSFGGDRGGGRGGRGGGRGWGGDRGGRSWGGDRGGRGGGRGGFSDRGGRGGRGRGRGAPRGTPRSGGITSFEGTKVTF